MFQGGDGNSKSLWQGSIPWVSAMKMKPVEEIERTIQELDGMQQNMHARQRVLMTQVEDLERDIERISDTRGGLILLLERVYGIRPE